MTGRPAAAAEPGPFDPAQAGRRAAGADTRSKPAIRRARGRRHFVMVAMSITTSLLVGLPAFAQAPAGGPGWNQLSPQQREALTPLAGQWGSMPVENKRKWLEIADRYPQLSPEGKARLQARMSEFSQLTPEQRRTARQNFQRAYELPRESRESAVEQYRSLPEEKKKELSERGRRKDARQSAADR